MTKHGVPATIVHHVDASQQRLLESILSVTLPVVRSQAELRQVPRLLEPGREFCASLEFSPEFVAECLLCGYMPMGTRFRGLDILLVKSHEKRCLLDAAGFRPSKSTLRHSRGLSLYIDRDFAGCLDSVVGHHVDRWLTEPLCEALRVLHRSPVEGLSVHSVEAYGDDRLVAGELGVVNGGLYTSMAGFHGRSGAGSVQLAALAQILVDQRFPVWDLGMIVPYKLDMGSRIVARTEFLRLVAASRGRARPLVPARPPAATPATLQRGGLACEELVRRRRKATTP